VRSLRLEDHAGEVEVLTLPGNCGTVAQMGRDRAYEGMANLTVGLQTPPRLFPIFKGQLR
jgi:hypothetical protein